VLPDWEKECVTSEDNDTDVDDGLAEGSDSEDVSWCALSASMLTWDWCEESNAKVSNRVKYQQQPVKPYM
jgi:hypothetical protein